MTEGYKKSATRDTVESLVVTVILAVFGTTFVIQAFKIPTGSMEDTLLIGDHLLVNKFAFASQPGWIRHLFPYRRINRDDVVVFKYPYRDDQTQARRSIRGCQGGVQFAATLSLSGSG